MVVAGHHNDCELLGQAIKPRAPTEWTQVCKGNKAQTIHYLHFLIPCLLDANFMSSTCGFTATHLGADWNVRSREEEQAQPLSSARIFSSSTVDAGAICRLDPSGRWVLRCYHQMCVLCVCVLVVWCDITVYMYVYTPANLINFDEQE